MSKFSGLGINVSSGERMPLINPRTGEPIKDKAGKEAYIALMSDHSPKGILVQKKLARRALERKQRRTESKNIEEAVDDLLEVHVEKIAGLATDWYLVTFDGEPITEPSTDGPVPIRFSEENIREFLSDNATGWVRDQALRFIEAPGNFIKAASGS